MDKLTQSEKSGLKLRTLNYVLAFVALVISVFLFFSVYQTSEQYTVARAATDNYILLHKCAHSMQETSDFLTEQVRCFAVTGERMYLDAYFEEANVTQSRDRALETLESHLGESEIYTALENAMRESVDLMQREYYSMRLTIEANGWDLTEFPDEIQNVNLSIEDAALSPEQKREGARQMVFDAEYRQRKDRISHNVNECIDILENTTESNQLNAADRLHDLLMRQQVLIAALIATVLGFALLVSVEVISPLLRAIPRIREGKPIPVRGANEFRFLASTYNSMAEANRKSRSRLLYEAQHDQLTDLLNRNGYESLTHSIDPSTSVLLIIDIDHFKDINDTYGHDIGDRALALTADTLKENFRENDYVFRFGGDEFAVIMLNADQNCRELIAEKAKKINEVLVRGEDGLPPFTVSVGVSFGKPDSESQNLFKEADIALYRVKETNRGGLEFYA